MCKISEKIVRFFVPVYRKKMTYSFYMTSHKLKRYKHPSQEAHSKRNDIRNSSQRISVRSNCSHQICQCNVYEKHRHRIQQIIHKIFRCIKISSINKIPITITNIHSVSPSRLMHKIPSKLCLLPETGDAAILFFKFGF